jgi:hypothetical protein
MIKFAHDAFLPVRAVFPEARAEINSSVSHEDRNRDDSSKDLMRDA